MMNELPPYGMTQLPPLSQSPSEGHAEAHAEVGKIVELAKRFPN